MRGLSAKYLDPRRYAGALRRIASERQMQRMRRAVETRYRRAGLGSGASGAGTILCEGMWDNPNHFFRLHLMLSALTRTGRIPVVGVLHHRWQARQRRSLKSLGAETIVYLDDQPADRGRFLDEARRLLDGVRSHRDILELKLPQGLPAYIYYDTVLKRTRHPQPSLESPLWTVVLAEVLRNLVVYEQVFREHGVAHVIASHPWKNEFATLCWTALRHGVPCYYVTGFCDGVRVRRLGGFDDFLTPIEHGAAGQFDALPPESRRHLVEYGRVYLAEREQGTSSDINTRYAFRLDRRATSREAARRALGADNGRLLVAVYAQVWFDFPHTFAMQNFTDFLDWMCFTVEQIARNTSVTWLLKPHPCDQWYGGVRLAQLVADLPPHVRLCSEDTDSLTVQLAADAVVTVHGTIGIEAAARGLPVVNADRTYYGDWEFTHVAKSREDYAALLAGIHQLPAPTLEQQERAMAFAALALAPTPEEVGLLRMLCDTTEPTLLYAEILEKLDRDQVGLEREQRALLEWVASGHGSYAAHHTMHHARRA